ncbi:MAG: CPBP family intramembrane metalloprotease domain-containing protein [Flavobacteriia bacterium]|nr:MAG: CPBP family intramembrane metalloprotease domain-containing protein [Flavobacteriia bacterium]
MNFIEQAYKGRNDFIYYFATLAVVFVGWQIIGIIPLVAVAYYHADSYGDFIVGAENAFATMGINSNLYLLVMILSFAFALLSLFIGVKYIHKRTITSLITARKKIDWKRFSYAFGIWIIISLISISIDFIFEPESFVWNFKPLPFLILVVISFLFLPIQTSFEELLFRGYLMQGFGILFKNAIYPLIITSLIFGLLHYFNPEVQKLGSIILIYYVATGLLFGIVTLMDDGTELALGMHAANNIVAAVLVTSDWMVFQTDALWVDVSEPSAGFETFFPVLVVYPVVIWIFSKKYRWKDWKSKLFAEIKKPLPVKKESI